jgi:hypothetical protein
MRVHFGQNLGRRNAVQVTELADNYGIDARVAG